MGRLSIKRESGQVFSQPSFAIDVFSDFWETFQTLNEVSPKKAEKYLKVLILAFVQPIYHRINFSFHSCFQGEFSNLLGIVRKMEEMVAAKEEIFRKTVAAKEEIVRKTVAAKEEIVRKTEEMVAAKEEIILMKNIEILKAKGL